MRIVARQTAVSSILFGLLLPICVTAADGPQTATVTPPPAPIERLGEEATRALHQLYEVNRTIPLEARVVEKIEKDGFTREKIVFRSVQGFLVPGYLQYPTERSGPVPCVMLLHGWSGSKEHWWSDGNYIKGGNVRRALLEAGYAIFALDAQCHGDRIAQNDFAPVNHYTDPSLGPTQRRGYFTQQEIYIQTARDYRRALDYLESRPDMDAARIGMVGYSMGGAQTFLVTGVDRRIKVAVSCCPPADLSKWSPIAPQNFSEGIANRPFLMIMGTSDPLCHLEHARQLHLMINSDQKQLVEIDADHKLPVEYVPVAIAWIKKHL